MKSKDTYRHRWVAVIILLLLLSGLFACSDKVEQLGRKSASQGVSGVVTLTPGYDGEDFANQINPPDRTPRPLFDATVYLILKDSVSGAYTFLDSVTTDSAGRYVLPCPPGRYYVAASVEGIVAPVLVSLPGDTSRLQRKIQALAGLNVLEGLFTNQPLNVAELSTE